MRGDGFKEIEPRKKDSPEPELSGGAAPEKGKAPSGFLSGAKKVFDPDSVSGLAVTLFLITAVVALMLGFVNQITAPEIARRAEEASREAMTVVLSAHEYIQAEDTALYRAQDADGRLVGFVVQVSPAGYGGAISMMVGVDLQPAVTGVSVISHSETPNLGSKAAEPEFLDLFVGKSVSMKLGEDIDAISGATVSSRAVFEGVQEALEKVLNYLAGGGGA